MKPIAHIENGFSSKFGIPRQSGLVGQVRSTIVFEPEYRDENALRGIEKFSHLWLIWSFSETKCETWRPMVRPPRLGGNVRVGVFATRSPFRPNAIGLSCVELLAVRGEEGKGMVLEVAGADLLNGTPIYDIKPYLSYVDSHPEARDGFAEAAKEHRLEVEIPEEWEKQLPVDAREAVRGILAQDPRPGYQRDPDRIFGIEYGGFNIRFYVSGKYLKVVEVKKFS